MEFNVNPEYGTADESVGFFKIGGEVPTGELGADPLALFPPVEESEEVDKKRQLSPDISATEIDLTDIDETALALDSRDVVRLMEVIKEFIEECMLEAFFEFNDENSQKTFTKQVEGYLEEIRMRGAVWDYAVVCDTRNNPPEIVDSDQFVADIYINPTKSPNYIQLNFIAEPTSVNFDEIVNEERPELGAIYGDGDGDDDEDNFIGQGWNYNE